MKGSISIHRVYSSHEDDRIRVEITDELSRTRFVSFETDLENFAKALMGQREVDGTFSIAGINLIGMIAENKTEIVKCQPPWNEETKKEANVALKKYEVDGWKARRGDIDNHHNFRKGGVEVVFSRHVAKDCSEDRGE